MKVKTKYVILFNDQCKRMVALEELLQQLPFQVETDCVENIQHLSDLLDRKLPDLIVIQADKKGKSHMDYLKSMRVNDSIDEIPVYFFQELPDIDTVRKMLESGAKGAADE